MQESIDALLRIAQEDHRIFLNQGKLKEFPARKQKLQDNLNRAEEALKGLQAKLKDLSLKIVMRERLVEVEQDKITKANERMMTVKNQKEYMAFQKEIETSQKAIKKVEDQIIELEEQKEPIEKEVLTEKESFEQEKARFDQEEAQVLAEETVLNQEIAQAQAVIAGLSPQVQPELWTKYKKLVEKNVFPAAMEISSPGCGGCAMAIRAQLFNELIRAVVGECPSCRRILFYKAPEPAPEVKKTKKR